MRSLAFFALLLAACGTAQPGGMSGPTMNNKVEAEESENPIQSNDMLHREAVTNRAKVKHVLIGWADLAAAYDGQQDSRGAARSKADADKLAVEILERVRKGDPIDALMEEFSEDSGSATTGDSYEVTPDARLVPEFKQLGLRLQVGEAGLVQTQFGWHIIQRVE
jgi:hypothetical protein